MRATRPKTVYGPEGATAGGGGVSQQGHPLNRQRAEQVQLQVLHRS